MMVKVVVYGRKFMFEKATKEGYVKVVLLFIIIDRYFVNK